MVSIPDLLNLEPRIAVDEESLGVLLELAFLGKEAAKGLDRHLGQLDSAGHGWEPSLFAEDLFLEDLIRESFTLELNGVRFPVNQAFFHRVLIDPPTELAQIEFRQEILRELLASPELERKARDLYLELSQLLSMFKAPDHAAKLDINAYRLDIFRQTRRVVEAMVRDFEGARSGLSRLHRSGEEIQGSKEYHLMSDLLDYEQRSANLRVSLDIGADGEVKDLEILELREDTANRYYTPPWKRFLIRLRAVVFHGYRLSHREIVNRLLSQVYTKVAPAFVPLVQLMGQLEFYLAALEFRRRAGEQGLAAELPSFSSRRVRLHRVFNPLLLTDSSKPVPCDLESSGPHPITLITGPNSGGKTRLLQTVGLTQLLAQSGLFVPAAEAELPLVKGLFVSLVENESADQAEGRLGRELMRIRSLFESVGSPSMVILDELCSGTNPSEGTEIFEMVVRLLGRLDTLAFISTHFLDFARSLEADPPIVDLEFLQVESSADLCSTYQFLPGVAESSLARATAERLGVTFEDLDALIDSRQERERAVVVG